MPGQAGHPGPALSILVIFGPSYWPLIVAGNRSNWVAATQRVWLPGAPFCGGNLAPAGEDMPLLAPIDIDAADGLAGLSSTGITAVTGSIAAWAPHAPGISVRRPDWRLLA